MKEIPQKKWFKRSRLQKGLDLLKSCIWGPLNKNSLS